MTLVTVSVMLVTCHDVLVYLMRQRDTVHDTGHNVSHVSDMS